MSHFARTRVALAHARELHEGQSRKADGAPFIAHPREVACLLYDAGAPDHLIAAGALHDTLEKTDVSAADLRRRFGSRIAALVLAVSEDERIRGYGARKAALRDQVARAGEQALMLLAADKISKARELRLEGAAVKPRNRRVARYQRCLALLQEHPPDSPLVDQLEVELANLARGAERHRRAVGTRTRGCDITVRRRPAIRTARPNRASPRRAQDRRHVPAPPARR